VTISFACEHCGKRVEAPDSAGGKRGKCPYCHQSNYIPSPVAEEEVLDLAPVDEQAEQRRREEVRRLMAAERDALLEDKAPPPAPPLEQREQVSSADLHHFVVNYCLDMAGSKLERAQTHVKRLRRFGPTAVQAVDDFLSGRALEPALDSVPRRLLEGFLKQLRDQLT
jgi:phage FluMu protein Com